MGPRNYVRASILVVALILLLGVPPSAFGAEADLDPFTRTAVDILYRFDQVTADNASGRLVNADPTLLASYAIASEAVDNLYYWSRSRGTSSQQRFADELYALREGVRAYVQGAVAGEFNTPHKQRLQQQVKLLWGRL